MRALAVSVAALALVLGLWTGLILHGKIHFEEMQKSVEESLLPTVTEEQWEEAEKILLYIKEDWQSTEGFYILFMDGGALSDIRQSLSRIQGHLAGTDQGGALAEIHTLGTLLEELYKNELLTIENLL